MRRIFVFVCGFYFVFLSMCHFCNSHLICVMKRPLIQTIITSELLPLPMECWHKYIFPPTSLRCGVSFTQHLRFAAAKKHLYIRSIFAISYITIEIYSVMCNQLLEVLGFLSSICLCLCLQRLVCIMLVIYNSNWLKSISVSEFYK